VNCDEETMTTLIELTSQVIEDIDDGDYDRAKGALHIINRAFRYDKMKLEQGDHEQD